MRTRLLPVLVAALTLAGLVEVSPAGAAPAEVAETATDDIVPGEVIVAVEPGEPAAEVVDDLMGRPGRRVPGRPDLRLVRTRPGREASVADRLERSDDVRWSTPNAVFHASAVPNDQGFRFQWGLQTRTTVPGAANWSPIWGGAVTGAGVTVAVLDTGVTAGEDLDGVLAGYDFVAGDSDPADENGHGTHVAGTVAQSTGNSVGVAGVASGANILPIRVLDRNGDGSAVSIISAISWAVSRGADVINVSLGGAVDGGLCDAVRKAVAAGAVVVAAVGNEGGAVGYPASCPGVIGVGATLFTGAVAPYSNRGSTVALVAPGGDLNADVNRDGEPEAILQYSVVGGVPGYYYLAGTSMAAPHVAGAVALLLQANPNLTLDQVRGALTGTAVDLGSPGPDTSYGAGLLDVAAALRAVQTNTIPAPVGLTPPPAGPAPERLSGASRYGTAAAISRDGWPTGAANAFLAGGTTFPDALATGALAGRRSGPLLLAGPCTLPPESATELSRLRPAKLTVVGGPGAVCDEVVQQAVALTGGQVERLAGPDRYATAVALSGAGWPSSAAVVYLASGTSFADGLSGSALAPQGDGPLLLTEPCSLPDATKAELRRLRPARILVLGGAASVCEAVVAAATAESGAVVTRVAGPDRYATAVAAVTQGWSTAPAVVYVASGSTFPDGLAVGPLAAKTDGPLLLVPPCDLPGVVAEALDRLNPAEVVVVGGTAAVCDDAARRLAVFAN